MILDEYITESVRGIVDVIFRPGLINLDFADVKTIMQSGGKGNYNLHYY